MITFPARLVHEDPVAWFWSGCEASSSLGAIGKDCESTFEKGVSVLSPRGLFSLIIPNKWFRANYGYELRKYLKNQKIIEIVDFDDLQVFKDATTYPCIISINNQLSTIKNISSAVIKSLDFVKLSDEIIKTKCEINFSNLDDECWCLTSDEDVNLLNKIKSKGVPFGDFSASEVFRGVLS